MIETLLVALIYIAIVLLIGWVIVHLLGSVPNIPPMVTTVVWAVFIILALLILLRAVTGASFQLP